MTVAQHTDTIYLHQCFSPFVIQSSALLAKFFFFPLFNSVRRTPNTPIFIITFCCIFCVQCARRVFHSIFFFCFDYNMYPSMYTVIHFFRLYWAYHVSPLIFTLIYHQSCSKFSPITFSIVSTSAPFSFTISTTRTGQLSILSAAPCAINPILYF